MIALGAVSAAALLLPPAAPAATPAPDRAADAALAALLTRPAGPAAARLPADFTERMGYRPEVSGGLLGNPSGDCSSPVPLPAAFTPACRQHDLAYDLLRYAADRGAPLPPRARVVADRALTRHILSTCPQGAPGADCRAAAAVVDLGVRLNSTRQHDGVPGPETASSVAGLGLLGGSATAATTMAVGAVRRRRGERR